MQSPLVNPGERAVARRALAIVVLLALAALIAGAVVFDDAPPGDSQRATAPAVAATVAEAALKTSPAQDAPRTDAAPAEAGQVFLCTFADRTPMPSILWDLDRPVHGVLDWSMARPRHAVPAAGAKFAVLARGCQMVFVLRSELPDRGEHRVDLRRSPVLDVRLINVPPTLRERLNVQLQVSYGQLPKHENIASVLMQDRGPILMQDTDRALIPLALPLPGFVVVHAISRHSTHSYPTPEIRFEPVSQVIEIDLGCLASACSLADLSLTLRFPYAHPDGEMDLSLCDAAGSTMMFQRCKREGRTEVRYVFRDLPRASVHPLLQLAAGVDTWIPLEPIDLTGGSGEAARDVVAESSLKVVLTGRDGIAKNDCSVLLRRPDGQGLVANWPRGNETRFQHVPAMTLYAQAIAYGGRRCSPIVRVELGVAQAHEIALQLVPAGEIEVAAGAFGSGVRSLDVHYAGQDPSHVGLSAEHLTRFWLPLGEPRVEWAAGSRTLRVEPGVCNRWQ